MADVKISGLPASTVPLAGTEVLPIVQGGATKQVSIANVTAGRAIAATSITTDTYKAASSSGGALQNSGGTPQLQWGAGGGNNLSVDVAININPANAAVAISPTGTGTVAISPAGALTINPTAASTINNVAIGGTTPLAGKFTTLEATGVTTLQAGSVSAPALTTTGDTNTGIFFPAADTIAFTEGGVESMRITSAGDVGIGTISPSGIGKKLNIAGTSTSSGSTVAVANSDNSVFLVSSSGHSTDSQAIYFSSTLRFATATGINATGFTERMRINSSGGVSIGNTTDPGAGNLRVAGSIVIPDGSYSLRVPAGSVGGSGVIFGADGNANSRAWQVFSNSSAYGLLDFRISSTNAESGFASKMALDTNGYLLVGYTSSNGAYNLQVNSQIFATSATIATSDARYKKDVKAITGALDIVNALNPVEFNWKEHPVHNFDTKNKTIGFLAQEVQEVLKNTLYVNSIIKKNDCVLEQEQQDKDGNIIKAAVTEDFLGIAEGNMIAILTKAIQELNNKFDAYVASHP